MLLSRLLQGIEIEEISGSTDREIKQIAFDTSKVEPQTLFVALKGSRADGHDYLEQAKAQGCSAAVTEHLCNVDLPQIVVKDSRAALTKLCARLHGNPERKLKVITVVGTNGKTSITYLVEGILREAGIKCGVIGTLGTVIAGKKVASSLTTPDPTELFALLANMVREGVEVCVMEASAHAIYLKKLEGVRAEVGIFTNLTQDHLDYFGSMEEYSKVKMGYFTSENCRYALINADDRYGLQMIEDSDCDILTYGLVNPADIFAVNYDITERGNRFTMNLFDLVSDVQTNLYGKFNLYNCLAAAGTARILGVEEDIIVSGLRKLKMLPGRFNLYRTRKGGKVVIDYAHTPDGMKNVLSTAKEITAGRLICVFGCGGNRDRIKRSIMGEIADCYADFTVITSDNPRYEDPVDIMREIELGMSKNQSKYIMIENRKRAVVYAVTKAEPGDTVVICGKGGEDYQEIAGVRVPYRDEETIKSFLADN